MKKFYKYFAMFILMLFICPFSVAAQKTVYVNGITKITMRTEPGVDHKIVAMLKSNTPLEVIEHSSGWSKVKTKNGKEGWILTRFITEDVPKLFLVKGLEQKNQSLMLELESLKNQNRALLGTKEKLEDIEKKYFLLKQKSADFLKLEKEYNEIKVTSEEQVQHINKLEADLGNEKNIFFLLGAGVFIFGLILGVTTKKKRRSSLL